MQLNNLKPAWEQMKLLNAMEPISAGEILSIIEQPQNIKKDRVKGIILNVAMFIIIAICCQGG